MITWAKNQTINLKPKSGESFGIAYDDPKITPAQQFRFDLGITIPQNLKIEETVIEKYLPAGRYAITMRKGSHQDISDTVYALYREWLPNSGEELGDFPGLFSSKTRVTARPSFWKW